MGCGGLAAGLKPPSWVLCGSSSLSWGTGAGPCPPSPAIGGLRTGLNRPRSGQQCPSPPTPSLLPPPLASRKLGKRDTGFIWVLFMKGWSMKSSLEKNPGSPRAGLQQQQPPSRSGATQPVRAPDPCTKRTRGRGSWLSWEHLYFTCTKAPDPCKRAERQRDKGDAAQHEAGRCPARVPQLREERIHNFTLFFPKGWCPVASAGAEGPGSKQLHPARGTGIRAPSSTERVPDCWDTAAPSPGTGKSRRKEPGAALGAQPDPALTPRGSRCPPTDTGPPVGARPGSWPKGRGPPRGIIPVSAPGRGQREEGCSCPPLVTVSDA